jgi:purine-binding chemotaxis protein CheW
MDILAARKKAAERAQAGKPADTAVPAEAPAAPAVLEETPAPAASAVIVEAAGSPAVPPVAAAGSTPVATAPSEAPAAPAEDRDEAAKQELEMLSFRLSHEEYAVFVDDVREVLKVRDLTRVPNAPEYVLGVTSLRGMMLPVMDLCTRLGLKPVERDEKARIIVVSPDEEDVGLLVDRVTGVIRIPQDAIKPAPDSIEQGAEYLYGIVRHNDKLYIVLDLVKAAG